MGHRAGQPRRSNLPAELTSFVGRRGELREVKRLLTTTPLLTLTGSGGAGKTRLALRAAAEMSRGFPDGAWLVSLASVQDPMLVPQAVFGALGVHDLSAGLSLSSLARYLADRRLLLVLDNCEHLLDACATLASTVIGSCPDLLVLATSRQALGVAGEVRMVVPPMSLPESGDDISVQQALTSDAVWLLAERAGAVVPGFALSGGNAAAVAELCRRLDGIPLALELAAVRLGSLSLDQLNHGLASELSILGGGNRGALEDWPSLSRHLETLARMAAEQAAYKRAVTLLGFAQHTREAFGFTVIQPDRPQHDRSVELAADGLGQGAFDLAFQRGWAMAIDEGVTFAVDDKLPPMPAPAARPHPHTTLTRRQLDIARLVADDLSNKQIAARLFLSERTVETHVTNIMNKLGLNSRIQLSRWAADVAEQG